MNGEPERHRRAHRYAADNQGTGVEPLDQGCEVVAEGRDAEIGDGAEIGGTMSPALQGHAPGAGIVGENFRWLCRGRAKSVLQDDGLARADGVVDVKPDLSALELTGHG
jgi:hypothetical protein